jgi:hypothetical protein
MRSSTILGLGLSLLICATALESRAQMKFTTEEYTQLADESSSATIPAGTKITNQNWQQYKQFMPMWVQALYGGRYHFRVGDGPEYARVVAPFTDFPLRPKFQENTEKYSGQVRLKELPWGGYTIENYVGGVPFPKLDPKDAMIGVKLLYNLWYYDEAAITHNIAENWGTDRFGNVQGQLLDINFYRLMHLSESDKPLNLPFANGAREANRYYVLQPEQSKYTTELERISDDPTTFTEVFVFLPSLRRSLRLSTAARCSPILGTDYITDDSTWVPGYFRGNYLGIKKILVFIQDYDKAHDKKYYTGGPADSGAAFPGWPKADSGHYELRPAYVVEQLPILEKLGKGYCYSRRVYFIDKQTWWYMAGTDQYDREGKLWKSTQVLYAPHDMFDGVRAFTARSYVYSEAWDWQNSHSTQSIASPQTYNKDTPAETQDVGLWSSPSGLAHVMK